jgi:hypothetical protein
VQKSEAVGSEAEWVREEWGGGGGVCLYVCGYGSRRKRGVAGGWEGDEEAVKYKKKKKKKMKAGQNERGATVPSSIRKNRLIQLEKVTHTHIHTYTLIYTAHGNAAPSHDICHYPLKANT